MEKRRFGQAAIEVSEIGIGGHREGVETRDGLARQARFFDSDQSRAAVIGEAIDRGVTYFDTTFGCEIESLGRSLRILGRRDGLFVSGMRVDFFSNYLACGRDIRAYTRTEVEGRLKEFGFDHMEQFLLGAMESGDPLSHPTSLMQDAMDELDRCRQEGKIDFIGFSCHDSNYAARLLEAVPAFQSVMTPYNFVNRRAEGDLAKALKATGAAWIVMKPLVWHVYGVPVTTIRNLRPASGQLQFDPSAPIAQLALRWVLANELVTTTVPAVNSCLHVQENTSASGQPPLSDEETRHLTQYAAAMTADDMKLLAIAGVLEDNLRVRGCAVRHIAQKFSLDLASVDFAAADAPVQMQEQVQSVLKALARTEYSQFFK